VIVCVTGTKPVGHSDWKTVVQTVVKPGVDVVDAISHSGQYVTVMPLVTVIMLSIDMLGQSLYVTVR
jgi:hypothetical protein